MKEKWTKGDDGRYEELRGKGSKRTYNETEELRALIMKGQRIGLFGRTNPNTPNAIFYMPKQKVLEFPVVKRW